MHNLQGKPAASQDQKVIYLASANPHKVEELKVLLAALEMEVAAAPADFTVDEDQLTFAQNAEKKARAYAQYLADQGLNPTHVLADDSGLTVDALEGRPGVRSARFGHDAALARGIKPLSNQDEGCRQALLDALARVPLGSRTAQLRCVLALFHVPGNHFVFFEGLLEGSIAHQSRGRSGFGYDPLFVPNGETLTLSELGPDVKEAISHRAIATRRLEDHFLAF